MMAFLKRRWYLVIGALVIAYIIFLKNGTAQSSADYMAPYKKAETLTYKAIAQLSGAASYHRQSCNSCSPLATISALKSGIK